MLFLFNSSFCSDSAKSNDLFKILNREVMTDWAQWIIRWITWDTSSPPDEPLDRLLRSCVEGLVGGFEAQWPDIMQDYLPPI